MTEGLAAFEQLVVRAAEILQSEQRGACNHRAVTEGNQPGLKTLDTGSPLANTLK